MPDESHEILVNVIAGIVIFLALVSPFIFILLLLFYQKKNVQHRKKLLEMEKQYREQLLQSRLETQEYSFNQISQELHDNIGQLLSSAKLLLSITAMELQSPPHTLKTAEQTVAKAILDLRSLSKSLSKEWLHQFNLVENLEAEKNRINTTGDVSVQLNSDFEKLPLAPDAQVMLFRVIQEALQNSIKHAFPKHIFIQIKNTNNHLELNIEDDGRGFDIASAKKDSLGLRNMEHRVQLLGGSIEWLPGKESGTLITIKLPAKRQKFIVD